MVHLRGLGQSSGETCHAALTDPALDDGSKLVSEAKETTGLVEFLQAEPQLTKDTDLRPYLFLAQTALSREGASQLAPLDETARSLASQMRSTDRVPLCFVEQDLTNRRVLHRADSVH
jgi:hypothetical protein